MENAVRAAFDQLHRRLIRLQSRQAFFFIDAAVVPHFQKTNQDRQRQTLQNKSGEDDGKGKEEDVIARRKFAAVGEREGQGKGGGERHDTTHASPARR